MFRPLEPDPGHAGEGKSIPSFNLDLHPPFLNLHYGIYFFYWAVDFLCSRYLMLQSILKAKRSFPDWV
jgi:hypothetical protein